MNRLHAFLWAIGQQESGGRYNEVNSSSGAVGKYQVMPANIPVWTKEALGHSLTPEQFRASPQAQEKVAKHVLGGYFKTYGAKGAAAAWYAGPANHSMYTSTAAQPGGPSIAGYVNSVVAKMNTALNGKARVHPVATGGGTSATSTNGGGATATDAGLSLGGIAKSGLGLATTPLRLLGEFGSAVSGSITGEVSKLLVSGAGLMVAGGLVLLGLNQIAKPAVEHSLDDAIDGSSSSGGAPPVAPASSTGGAAATAEKAAVVA